MIKDYGFIKKHLKDENFRIVQDFLKKSIDACKLHILFILKLYKK